MSKKNKNKKVTAVLILLLVVILVLVVKHNVDGDSISLLNPLGKNMVQSTPAPTPNAPKIFKFDSSTDLKKELDSINPQVLDSDFE